MSKITFSLLMLALISLVLGLLTQDELGNAPLIASAVLFACWLTAKALGRRIKFDPQLR